MKIAEAVAERDAEIARLRAELALWKPMTPAEAQAAYDKAEAAPWSEEETQRVLDRVLDPAESLNNLEEAQLHVVVKRLRARVGELEDIWYRGLHISALETSVAALRAALAERDAVIAELVGVCKRWVAESTIPGLPDAGKEDFDRLDKVHSDTCAALASAANLKGTPSA